MYKESIPHAPTYNDFNQLMAEVMVACRHERGFDEETLRAVLVEVEDRMIRRGYLDLEDLPEWHPLAAEAKNVSSL